MSASPCSTGSGPRCSTEWVFGSAEANSIGPIIKPCERCSFCWPGFCSLARVSSSANSLCSHTLRLARGLPVYSLSCGSNLLPAVLVGHDAALLAITLELNCIAHRALLAVATVEMLPRCLLHTRRLAHRRYRPHRAHDLILPHL
jgi:hypothetical protein